MRKLRFNALVLLGILGIFIGGSLFAIYLFRAFAGERNIWWTHQNLPLSIEESCGAFELHYKGLTLQQLLADGSLLVRDSDGSIRVVTAADWNVRLNNWHRVQSTFLAMSLYPCFLFSVSLTLLIVGIFQGMRKKSAGEAGSSL